MKELKDVSSALFARVREHRERPEALEQLEKSITNSREFLEKSRLASWLLLSWFFWNSMKGVI